MQHSKATISDAVVERDNSLNLVRLMLAFFVVVLHTWPIGDYGVGPGWIGPFGGLAVPGFFCLSGFLIARSRMRLSLGRYLWHRSLRIFPALWVVLLLVAFVAAPLSTLGGGTWVLDLALTYVVDNAKLHSFVWGIPGTVEDLPWNGSLWSLFYEFLAYIGAGLLLTLAYARRNARLVVPTVYLVAVAANYWANGPGEVTASLLLTSVSLATYFLAGMVLYFWADRVPIDARLAALAFVGIAMCWHFEVTDRLGGLPLAYFLMWLGAVIPARCAQRNDISYGVYIYAFPVQLLVWWLAPGLPVLGHLLVSTLFIVPLAWMSWLLVERPAMRLRNVGRRVSVTETAPSNAPAGHLSAPQESPTAPATREG